MPNTSQAADDKHPRGEDGRFVTGGGSAHNDLPESLNAAAASVSDAVSQANKLLVKAGGPSNKGSKKIREAVAILVSTIGLAVANLDHTILTRYGVGAATTIKLVGKFAPAMLPGIPDGIKAVPNGDMLVALPLIAVAEVAKRVVGQIADHLPHAVSAPLPPKDEQNSPPPIGNKRQQRLLQHDAERKATRLLRKRAKEWHVGGYIKAVHLSGDARDQAIDDLVRKAMGRIRKKYARWLTQNAGELKIALAPLAGHQLLPAGTEKLAAISHIVPTSAELVDFGDYVQGVNQDATLVTHMMLKGAYTLSQWRTRMMQVLGPMPLRAAFSASPNGIAPESWKLASEQTQKLSSHVLAMSQRLDSFEEDWNDAPARAAMYANVAHSFAQEHRRLAARLAGFSAECRESCGDCCDDCREQAGKGWQPAGELPPAGDCDCGTRCRCTFSFGHLAPKNTPQNAPGAPGTLPPSQ
jgi:hypothetical protein